MLYVVTSYLPLTVSFLHSHSIIMHDQTAGMFGVDGANKLSHGMLAPTRRVSPCLLTYEVEGSAQGLE